MAEEEVATYSNTAFQGAWSARGRAIWGIAILGAAFGAATGVIAPFFPVLAGVVEPAAALALVPASAAIYTAIGMASGFGVGGMVGAAAGASAAIAKESERRSLRHLKSLGLPLPAPETKALAPDTRNTWDKFRDVSDTYFNPKVGAVFTLLGAVGGLIMAAAYIAAGGLATNGANATVPAMNVLLGEAAASQSAVVSYFTGVMASFGALWAFNFPKMADELQHFTGRVMSGELLNSKWEPRREKARASEVDAPTTDASITVASAKNVNVAKELPQTEIALLQQVVRNQSVSTRIEIAG